MEEPGSGRRPRADTGNLPRLKKKHLRTDRTFVQQSRQPEVLAEAAAGLSRQLLTLLESLGEQMRPHLGDVERRFEARLKQKGYTAEQCVALTAISAGTAARRLAEGDTLAVFLEEVQYRGRRLAKLRMTPALVVAALHEYDMLFDEALHQRTTWEVPNLEWVRSQLHFLVTLTLNNAFYHVREAESRAFYELFRAEVEARSLGEMLPRFLDVLKEYTKASAVRLYLVGEEGECELAASLPQADMAARLDALPAGLKKPVSFYLQGEGSERQAKLALDQNWRAQYGTCWSVPLLAGTKLRGVLQFAFPKPYHWLPREQDLLRAAAERCWLATDKAKLLEDLAAREEQVRRLAEHMVEVEESERRRISRELHDEAGQSLLCIRLQLEMLEQEMAAGTPPRAEKLGELREMTEHTILEIRRLIAALSPAILEQMGLAAAIRQLVGRFRRIHSAEVRIQLPRRLDLPKRVEIIVYRLVQEILNNIAKYSLASRVNLLVDSADGCLSIQVEDDGIGFDVDEAFARGDCFGLSGLRERVALLGGKLAVHSLRRPATDRLESEGQAGPKAVGTGPARLGARPVKRPEKESGQVGVDLHGTAIWVELPLEREGTAKSIAGARKTAGTKTPKRITRVGTRGTSRPAGQRRHETS